MVSESNKKSGIKRRKITAKRKETSGRSLFFIYNETIQDRGVRLAAAYVEPAIYNILVTFITGGVSMVIFFFVFKIIFPEGEAGK